MIRCNFILLMLQEQGAKLDTVVLGEMLMLIFLLFMY